MGKKTIEDENLEGQRVLVRVDFNVPLDKDTGEVMDDNRIRASLPTLQYLLDQNCKVIVLSHLGRPKGQVVESLRLNSVAERLGQLLEKKVMKLDDCVGPEVEAALANLQQGELALLENIRFHPEEEANDPQFAQDLAKLADVYVNDAFGTAHRAHASTEGVGKILPALAGNLMKSEISALAKGVIRPERPFVAIFGGAKISDKMAIIQNVMDKADKIIIGGGMANTLLEAQGYDMQASLVEKNSIHKAKEILEQSGKGPEFLLPIDLVVADNLDSTETQVVDVDKIPEGMMALDIGPKSCELFAKAISDAKTVVWNGPMGVFEKKPFSKGTFALAQAVADASGYTIVGGGDSAAAIRASGLQDQIDHVSTGGGASLVFMAGDILPGLQVIEEKERRKKA